MTGPRIDPLLMSATAMAQALRDGRTTSRELVDAHIARIEAVNPRINAVVQQRYAAARAEADAADIKLAKSRNQAKLPPLLGVPCTLKENFAFAGFPQVSGLVARRDARATEDAPTVARLRAAGAIPLGFTNTPELCMWMETNNRVYGRTRNPYDAARIVGGSIRFPAFFNGVFGHKPTPGIVPNSGQLPEPQGRMNYNCVTGPIARRAEDLWPLLSILAGPDGRDPVCAAGALQGDPAQVQLKDLHVLSVAGFGRRGVSADLRAAQRDAAEWLGEQTRGVEWRQPGALAQAFQIWAALMHEAGGAPFAVQLGQGQRIAVGRELLKWSVGRSVHTLPALGLCVLEAIPLSQQRFVELGRRLREELLAALGDDGVLLFPPYTRPAPRHNWPLATPFDPGYCGIFNVLGLPVTQVPLGLNREGLPLGVQVVGAPGRDATTIAVAMALEKQFGGWVPPFINATDA